MRRGGGLLRQRSRSYSDLASEDLLGNPFFSADAKTASAPPLPATVASPPDTEGGVGQGKEAALNVVYVT